MYFLAIVICLLAPIPIDTAYSSWNHRSFAPEPSEHPWPPSITPKFPTAYWPFGPWSGIPYNNIEWSGWGGNIYNNRWASRNIHLNSSSVVSLTQHCRLEYALGVSATPTLKGDTAYYPTWNGLLVALNYKTCNIKWQVNVTELIMNFAPISQAQLVTSSPVSRTSPQVDGDVLYFGTLTHALLFAVDANTGMTLGSIQINPHPLSILTMSPTVYNGRILIGASSQEELAASRVANYKCCTFVGNMAALIFDRSSGHFNVAWNVSMLPDPPGNWSGASIWGSQPSIDPIRSQTIIATGNIYNLPEEFRLCQNQSLGIAVVVQGLTSDPCLPPDVLQESIIAIDIDSGLINWVNQLSPLDAYSTACGPAVTGSVKQNCPFTPGPDADFGMAPTFVPGSAGTPYAKDTVIVGQKNGNVYAMSAQAGRLFWSTITSPDGADGGLNWGIAVDDSQVYFTAVNFNGMPWHLQPSNRTISNSAFGSASLANGTLLWETQSLPATSLSVVPPTIVNDVVCFGRTGNNIPDAFVGTHGGLLALNKYTGAVIQDFALDANFHGGIAIQDQYVMFGTGYQTYKAGNGSFHIMSV